MVKIKTQAAEKLKALYLAKDFDNVWLVIFVVPDNLKKSYLESLKEWKDELPKGVAADIMTEAEWEADFYMSERFTLIKPEIEFSHNYQ